MQKATKRAEAMQRKEKKNELLFHHLNETALVMAAAFGLLE